MTPEEIQQVAQLRAMALRGQEMPVVTQEADALSGVGGALAGLGGRSVQAMSKDMTGRGDALRQLVAQQTTGAQREAGDFARSIEQRASQRDISNANNAAEMERLKLQLGARDKEDAGKKAAAVAEAEGKYRTQLLGLQPVKDAMNMAAGYHGINEALKQNSAAGDMAGIFQFMKILDPSSSVREGEYASARNTTGVPEQLLNLYNKAIDGKLLSPVQRKDFLSTAKGKYSIQLKEAKKYADAFGKLATDDGGDPARVTTGLDFSLLDEASAPGRSAGGFDLSSIPRPATEAEYQQLPAGAIYWDPKKNKPVKKGAAPVATK